MGEEAVVEEVKGGRGSLSVRDSACIDGTMVVLGFHFSVVCTGFLEELLGSWSEYRAYLSYGTPGPKLHTVQNNYHLRISVAI